MWSMYQPGAGNGLKSNNSIENVASININATSTIFYLIKQFRQMVYYEAFVAVDDRHTWNPRNPSLSRVRKTNCCHCIDEYAEYFTC